MEGDRGPSGPCIAPPVPLRRGLRTKAASLAQQGIEAPCCMQRGGSLEQGLRAIFRLGCRRTRWTYAGGASLRSRAQRLPVMVCMWVLHLGVVGATLIEGDLPIGQPNFATFVGKFCYDFVPDQLERVGYVEINITSGPGRRPPKGDLYFMVFDDQKRHWKQAQRTWDSSSCDDKKQYSSLTTNIDLQRGAVGQEVTYIVRIRQKVRPRFWYFAFVACDMELTHDVRFSAHFTNDLWGWEKEFSFDRIGLYRTFQIASIAFVMATLATVYATREDGAREHPYVKLLLLSYMASTASCGIFFVHYWFFQQDGIGTKRLRFLGILAAVVANCTIFLIGILCSVGWAVTCSTVPYRRAFLGAVATVGGISALCELHAQVTLDESTKLYGYQSGPGVLALIMKVFIFCWFAFQIRATIEDEMDEKRRRFYKIMAFAFTICFLNVPVTVLLAFLISPWYRYKVVTIVDVVMRFCAQALFAHVLCGRFSPISAENTYPMRELSSFENGNNGFSPMSDGWS